VLKSDGDVNAKIYDTGSLVQTHRSLDDTVVIWDFIGVDWV
jgi:hypothetical protein